MALGGNLISPTHLLFVVLVLLIVFGPKRLPELGRGIGSAMKEFKGGIAGSGNDTAQVLESKTAPVPAADSKITNTMSSQ